MAVCFTVRRKKRERAEFSSNMCRAPFRGELHILLGTAEVADGAAKGCESLTAVSSTYTVGADRE